MKAIFRRGFIFSIAMSLIVSAWGGIGNQAHALDTEIGDGVLVNGQLANTTPLWRTYNMLPNSFGSPQNAAAGNSARFTRTKTSPIKQEVISAYVDTSNSLHVMCYDGTTWTQDWTVGTVGGGGAQARFDIAYEKTTGDVMVLYSRNTATTDEMGYRTKPGSTGCGTANWSSATLFDPVRTDGRVFRIRLEGSMVNGSNSIGAAWSDENNKLSAMMWTGTSWAVAEPTAFLTDDLERISTAGDSPSFDIATDSTSGNLYILWGKYNAGGNCVQNGTLLNACIVYARYVVGTGWVGPTVLPDAADEATMIDISAHPTSNEIIMAAIGDDNGVDLTTAYWSGSAWSVSPNKTGSAGGPSVGVKFVATGYLRSATSTLTRGIVVFATTGVPTTDIAYYIYNGASSGSGTAFRFTPTPTPTSFRWMDIQTNPLDTSQFMLVFSDSSSDLYAKRATIDDTGLPTWTNADGEAALDTNLGFSTDSPFGFAYWRYVPSIETVDIVNGAGIPIGAPTFGMSTLVTGNTCQTSTGTLGITGQRIRLTNTTANPAWVLSMAPTAGTSATWSSGTDSYDFNDPSGSPAGCGDGGDGDSLGGQLSVDPSIATITPKPGCTSTGVSLGSASAFSQGTIDAITLMSASSGASTVCYWDLVGVDASQKVPTYQPPGAYDLNMTLTVVAN